MCGNIFEGHVECADSYIVCMVCIAHIEALNRLTQLLAELRLLKTQTWAGRCKKYSEHIMSPSCLHHVPIMSPSSPHHVPIKSPSCPHHVSIMSPSCLHHVSIMSPSCPHHARSPLFSHHTIPQHNTVSFHVPSCIVSECGKIKGSRSDSPRSPAQEGLSPCLCL